MYFDMISNYPPSNINKEFDINEAREELYNYHMTVLDEAYYGKTKEIQSIEKKIGEIREKYAYKTAKANTCKEKEELEELFCEAFGFTCCSIHIDPSNGFNACTIPICNSVLDFRDFRKHIVSKNGQGIKYNKDANIYLIMNITKGLMFSSQFSDAEITAILLHEVGHNFQTAMSGKMRSLHMINKVFNLILAPIIMFMNPQAGPFRNAYTDLIKSFDKNYSEVANVYYTVNDFLTSVLEIGFSIISLISNITAMLNPIAVIEKIPENILRKLNLDLIFVPGGYKGEAISDNFASAYGYGVELSTGLAKMEKMSGGMVSNQIIRDIDLVGAYFDLLMLPNKIISNMIDPHPNTIARINNQYEFLHKEMIKKETNPKMKKELEKQLSELRKSMDKFVDAEEQGFFFSNRYDKALLMMCGGDIRNGFAKGINDDFDQAQIRAEKQLEVIKKRR